MIKVKTYAVTIRPRDGVNDSHITTFVAYVKRRCEYHYIVTEKDDDERHIHAALFFKKEQSPSNVSTEIVRLFKELTTDEKSVLRKGVRVMYNADFMTTYMNKGDSTVLIDRNLPEIKFLEAYYPPPLVSRPEAYALNHHREMKTLEALWYEHVAPHLEINTMNARDFLFDMQFNERKIGLMDDKKVFQTAKWLVRWMLRSKVCKLDTPCYEKEEGKGFH